MARPRSVTAPSPQTFRALASGTPSETANPDSGVTLGLEFTVTSGCYLTEIRWYQPTGGSPDVVSNRTAALWTTTDGSASVKVVADTALAPSGSGWQTIPISPSFALSPGTTYRAGVFHPFGAYPADAHYWDASGPGTGGLTSGPISVPNSAGALANAQSSFTGGGGIAFPSSVFNAANYWTDITVSTVP